MGERTAMTRFKAISVAAFLCLGVVIGSIVFVNFKRNREFVVVAVVNSSVGANNTVAEIRTLFAEQDLDICVEETERGGALIGARRRNRNRAAQVLVIRHSRRRMVGMNIVHSDFVLGCD